MKASTVVSCVGTDLAGVVALESLLATQTLWHAGRVAASPRMAKAERRLEPVPSSPPALPFKEKFKIAAIGALAALVGLVVLYFAMRR